MGPLKEAGRGDAMGPPEAVGRKEATTTSRRPMQKSDLFVVAPKPVKAGGAKGEMD